MLHGHTQDVKYVAWHPSRELLLSASYDDSVRIWACTGDDWECVGVLSGHANTVWSLAFSPSGDELATVSDDRSVILWRGTAAPGMRSGGLPVIDGMTWREESRLADAHSAAIFSVDWLKPPRAKGGERTMDAGDFLEKQRRDEAAGGGVALEVQGPTASPVRLRGFATCGADDAVRIFRQADTGAAAAEVPNPAPVSYCEVYVHPHAHSSDVNCVRWHPRDPALLFTAGDDSVGKIWRWGIPTGRT